MEPKITTKSKYSCDWITRAYGRDSSFKLSQRPNFNLIDLSIIIAQKQAQTFIDSDSTISVMSFQLFKQLKLKLINNSSVTVSQVNGISQNIGRVTSNITIGKTNQFHAKSHFTSWNTSDIRYLSASILENYSTSK
jgi:hypothetical protein